MLVVDQLSVLLYTMYERLHKLNCDGPK